MSDFLAAGSEFIKFESAILLLVLGGLLILAKIVSDLRSEVHSLRGLDTAPAKAVAPVSPAPAASEKLSESSDIPPDVFMAIVGAVYATLGTKHRVVSVNPAESLMWSREGRRSIFRSHTFR